MLSVIVNGFLRKGTHRLVKILAAQEASIRLHAYNSQTKEFISALGCEPPPLLERSLVACSGLLPQMSKGKVVYSNVSAEVAGPILAKLYG